MGKTTLLKLIGGLLTPQGGRVEVTGETLDPSNQKRLYRIRRRMGMLFQFGALFTDLRSSTTLPSRCASRRISTRRPFGIWCS